MGTTLDGAKFWVAGDLGDDFSDGVMGWAMIHFDPSVTKAQRDAITKIMGHVYPVKWEMFTMGADAPIAWQATRDRAEAKLDGGKMGGGPSGCPAWASLLRVIKLCLDFGTQFQQLRSIRRKA
jgi:hypothetical protein